MTNSVDLITAALVANVLQKDKGSDAKLLSWKVEAGAKDKDNYFNVVKRIRVEYSLEDRSLSTNYIAKLNPRKGEYDAFDPYRQRAMKKEVFFYHELVPLLNETLRSIGEGPLKVPKFLESSTDIGQEILFFEDLLLRGYETCDKSQPMDEIHCKLMVTEICRFHVAGRLLQEKYDKDLGEVFPLLIESWQCEDIKLRDAFDKVFCKGSLLNLNLAKAMGGYEDLLPWLKNLSKRGMEIIKQELQCQGPWRSLIHADCHRSNVMFRYDSSKIPTDIMMIDWQTLRMTNMAAELNYLLYSSCSLNRNELFPTILDTYFSTFQKINSGGLFFTKDELVNEINNNNVGFLTILFLIPMIICVHNPEELFKIDEEELKKYNDREALELAKEHLKEFSRLRPVMIELFNDARKKGLHLKESALS